ncbi:sulfite exporter TauE/SafE family protein [Sneathiella sp.]|jgi:uncharacterized membrane protein YfcA|uniref:sulfite exporter TauE/SafE family protein n=1 Tax=Sneathiella sp. TaxID=1964365 RepID=UPI0039E2B769
MQDALLIIGCIFLLAGTIKGLVGIGLPTAAISLTTQLDVVSEPQLAVALVIFPMMISNAWQVYRGGDIVKTARQYWPFLIIMLIMIYVFAHVSASIPAESFLIILGCVIVLFALTSLFVKPVYLTDKYDRPVQVVAGGISGIMGGLTGIWSPPMVIYFLSRRVEKDDFVRASGFLIFFGSIPLFFGYWQSEIMTETVALTSLLLTIPVIAGFTIGEFIRRKMDGGRFQKVLLIIFLLMGLNLIRKAIGF